MPLVAVRETWAGQAGWQRACQCFAGWKHFGGRPHLAFSNGTGSDGGSGGDGVAGLAQVFATDTAAISLADVTGFARGTGANGSAANGIGGSGEGGRVFILTEGIGDISLTGSATLDAIASGGDGQSGGDATGGEAGVYAMFGTIAVDGSVQLSADAIGGDATVGFGGNGGNALGGTAYVQADGSEEEGASLTIAGDATMLASGRGGVGGAGDGGAIAAGSGGSGTGGTYQGTPGSGGAFAIAGRDTGELSIGGETILVANGFGGAGGTGGTAQAGGAGGAGTGGTAQAGRLPVRAAARSATGRQSTMRSFSKPTERAGQAAPAHPALVWAAPELAA